MQSIDSIVTESEMHLITSKLVQNINQNPDQHIKTWIIVRCNLDAIQMQYRCNQMHYRCNLDANLDAVITESEMYLITSKLEQNNYITSQLDKDNKILIISKIN